MPRRDAFVAWAEGLPVPLFNPGSVIRWNTHKGYLRALADLGVPIAPTIWAEQGQPLDVAAELAARGWTRGFIKPSVGACAVGTLRFDADADGVAGAQAHADALLSAGGGAPRTTRSKLTKSQIRSTMSKLRGHVKRCFASLYTDRAISYRAERGFDHAAVALSVGVQRMVRSDLGAAGVMFTIDTETGFEELVLINAAWGLGEAVVQGSVVPDEFAYFKPTLLEGFAPIVKKA